MRIRKIKVTDKCPFCGRKVDKTDVNADSIVRENKYLQKSRQYFHKTCFQKFYSVRGSKNDRATTSTESN